jgi:hypothetical protein
VLARYLWPKLLADKVPGVSPFAGKKSTLWGRLGIADATLFTGKVSVAAPVHTVYRQSICGFTLLTDKVSVAAHC